MGLVEHRQSLERNTAAGVPFGALEEWLSSLPGGLIATNGGLGAAGRLALALGRARARPGFLYTPEYHGGSEVPIRSESRGRGPEAPPACAARAGVAGQLGLAPAVGRSILPRAGSAGRSAAQRRRGAAPQRSRREGAGPNTTRTERVS